MRLALVGTGRRSPAGCAKMARSAPVLALALLAVTSVLVISFTLPGYRTTLVAFSNSAAEGERECQKQRTSIFFLKTHKCASSTVQNILMRYGEKNGLDFVLPQEGNYVGNPRPFVPELVGESLRTPGGRYHVFTHHTRYNASGVRAVMREDAAYVTIMRDPARLFESLYSYYGMAGFMRMPLQQFIRLPLAELERLPRLAKKIGVNQMAWDLGTEVYGFHNEELLQSLIRHVESHFDLVMIAEYMEASLVLLKELMCWTLDDVTFFTLNARSAAQRANLTAWERRRVAEINSADAALYGHFLQLFRRRAREFGARRMREEVDALLRRNAELYERCVQAVLPPANPGGAYNDVRYQLRDDMGDLGPACRLVTAGELQFTAQLRERQARRLRVMAQLDELLEGQEEDRQSSGTEPAS
ncbi:galactosylceramide sulfotransferase-like isoform X2 [Bacillus rossius redtenbacheri]|uniref:galactosylceramide sulfotransferase-like isoform X2 n=1 Tax=Bacillus rossius redtenbacheri TaxID=93214 RepID=UPI002FDD9815